MLCVNPSFWPARPPAWQPVSMERGPNSLGFGRAGIQGCRRVGAYGRRRIGEE